MKLFASAFRAPFFVPLFLLVIATQLVHTSTALALEDSNLSNEESGAALSDEIIMGGSSVQETEVVSKSLLEIIETNDAITNNSPQDIHSENNVLPEKESNDLGALTPNETEKIDTGSIQLVTASLDNTTDAVVSLSDSETRDAISKASEEYANSHNNIFRVYNPNSGEHFFTSNLNEAKTLSTIGWQWETIAWVAPTADAPIYRLYNPNAGDHHYTMSKNESDVLTKLGWHYEGVGWNSDSAQKIPVYRLYNPNAKAGAHHFTTNAAERDYLDRIGWNYEGIGWFATDGDVIAIDAQWLQSPSWGSSERYWINTDGTIAKNRFILPEEGTGFLAYAKDNGAIVRGKWNNGAGYVYVADKNGKLASTPDKKTGWLVTRDYDNQLERYYYDAEKHAMRVGLFTVDGKQYYGTGNNGYVTRNNVVTTDGKTYYANNDGVLTETHSEHDITLARALAELSLCTNDSMTNEQKLRAAYNHIRDDFAEYNPRIPHMKQLGWETIYANDMFVSRGGNCCSYGAAFAFMAKAIGYSNVYCCNSGGHGWAEVEGRVYDPEWERANRGRSFFSVGYNDNSGVNYKVVLGNSDWMRVAI